jgi:hypothetical protein
MNKQGSRVRPDYLRLHARVMAIALALVIPVLPAAQQKAPTIQSPGSSTASPSKPSPACPPNVEHVEALYVEHEDVFMSVDSDTSTGSAVFKLKYGYPQCPITLHLSTTDFKSTTTNRELGAALAAFSPADPASKPFLDPASPTAMKSTDTVMVKIDVQKLWEAGESTAQLQQDGVPFAQIKAAKLRVPFTVKSGTLAGDDDGIFYPERESSVAVRNDDAMTYPVLWELQIDGKVAARSAETTLLPPKSTTYLKMKLADDFFTWPSSGMLQDDVEKATLQVHFSPPGSVQDVALPTQPIQYKLHLRYYSKGWQQGINLLWIIFFLLIGAAISIALNIGIPNQLKRNDVRKLIQDMGKRINALGSAAESTAVTFLRVERSRLENRLHEAYWFSPNLSAELPLIEQAIALLNGRVKLVSRVQELKEDLHAARTLPPLIGAIPPSLMDDALGLGQRTLREAVRPDLSDIDIAALVAAITTMQQRIATLGPADPLPAAIQALETSVKARIPASIAQNPTSISQAQYWSVFHGLELIFQSVLNASATINPDEYFNRDMTTQVATACADYIDFRKLLSDPKAIAAAEAQAGKTVPLLGQRTYAALLQARNIFECIREGVSADDVRDALQANPPKAEIDMIPSTPSTYDLVRLRVLFHDSALNSVAAHQLLKCKWVLPGVPPKYGWLVAHYFWWGARFKRLKKPWRVDVFAEFLDDDKTLMTKDDPPKPVRLITTISVHAERTPGQLRVLMLRTGLALFVALLGLVATAQTQIANLSIVPAILAVLLAGIVADSVKNLLTK